MRSFLFLSVMMATLSLYSCKKENAAQEMVKKTEQLLVGKWKVDKKTYDEYDPIPTLKTSEVIPGTESDQYYFKPEGTLAISDGTATEEATYQVMNPLQVRIDERHWWIKDLTSESVTLYVDRNDVEYNKRYVTKIFLKR